MGDNETMRPTPALFLLAPLSAFALQPREAAPRVAVMPFEGAGPEEAGEVGSALQAMLITDLGSTPSLRLVERGRLQDLVAEQHLGESGALDPATAPRFGRLLGASHVLLGRCTLVGPKLRLDTRLVAVEGGEVLLSESAEGDKEAFFELEKALANQLIARLGITLAPKERAQVARIHTADYGALRAFGRGLRLQDQKRTDQALAALREALKQDKDFQLAASTLDQYQQLIQNLKSRADSILDAQRELARAQADEAAGAEARLVTRLEQLAESPTAPWQARATALFSLGVALPDLGSQGGRLGHLRRVEDRFWMRREGEAAAARYVAEALKRFPALPVTIDESNYAYGLTADLEGFDKAWDYAVKKLLREGDDPENKKNQVFASLLDGRGTEPLLHLDARQGVAFQQQLYELSRRLGSTPDDDARALETLGRRWRSVLELDKSTACFKELSRLSDNPWRLKGIAKELEDNRDLAAVLAQAPEAREYLLLSSGNAHGAREAFLKGRKTPEQLRFDLTAMRKWPGQSRAYLLFDGLPAWNLGSINLVSTGPRTDLLHASELRYHRSPRHGSLEGESLLVLGPGPRGPLSFKAHVDYKAPEDFVPWEKAVSPGRPELSLLLGMTDVDCALQEDPATRKPTLTRPTRALAVVLKPDAVQLVRLTESKRDAWDRKGAFKAEVLASSPAKLDATAFDLTLTVAPGSLIVEAAGRTHRFKAEVPPGFPGLRMQGEGYVAVSKLRLQ